MVDVFFYLQSSDCCSFCWVCNRFEDDREVLPPNSEDTGSATAPITASHGIEVAVEFKPVEHPIEPLNNDRPIQCPLPEPSILNDGRLWKERVSATVPRRGDLPVMKEGDLLILKILGQNQDKNEPIA
ncbi:hypothetical protein Prudu_013471 [Prunus dulcis]|uniref:Uncharacterized protein n=1 Tax=Prunus dulcis TaxID=3755 RepID=A0A4Y1REV8_PRUDU|nr:hypothetical protein Prudu_013471 [Prunus dulcis]